MPPPPSGEPSSPLSLWSHPPGLGKVPWSLLTREARAAASFHRAQGSGNVYGAAAACGSRWFAGSVWREEPSSKEISNTGMFIEFVNKTRKELGQPALRSQARLFLPVPGSGSGGKGSLFSAWGSRPQPRLFTTLVPRSLPGLPACAAVPSCALIRGGC